MDLNELEYRRQMKKLQDEDAPVETPMVDPIDFIPLGGIVAKGVSKVGGVLKNAAKKVTEHEQMAMLGALERLNPSVALAKRGIIKPEYKAMNEGLQGQINDLGARVEAEAKNKLIDINRRRAMEAGVDVEAPTKELDLEALERIRKGLK